MRVIASVIGSRLDPVLAARLHDLEHRGQLDVLTVSPADMARRRFRARTEAGIEVAIALPRDQHLVDGAVLHLADDCALLVRTQPQAWVRFEPVALAEAIELGFHAGHLHWRVQFDGPALLVALEGPLEDYLNRLAPLLAGGRVRHELLSAGTVP
jgi:urease accessory protein